MSAKEPALRLRKSKSGIFGIFSRRKAEREEEPNVTVPVPVLPPASLPKPLSPQYPASTSKPSTGPASVSGRGSSAPSKARPISIWRSPLEKPPAEPLSVRISLKPSKSTKSLKSVKSARTNREDDTLTRLLPPFEPPPLFQAYPQSIRHTILEAPTSAQYNLHDGESQHGNAEPPPPIPDGANATLTVFQKLKARKRPRTVPPPRMVAGDSLDPTAAQKIYILVTTGYLLQYAGTGSFDRLPEKILKLTPSSAAFASDAIEGKHWVLEVVHEANGEDLHSDTRPFLSKVGLQGPSARKMVSNMLLIFAAPSDMERWMTSIREEIETMNGGSPRKKSDTTTTEQDLWATGNKRYSNIVRQPSMIRPETVGPPSSTGATTISPGTHASRGPSDMNIPGSETWSFKRASIQPRPPLPVRESIIFENSNGSGVVIGPAMGAPNFFEREAMPPSTSESVLPSRRSSLASTAAGPSTTPAIPVPDIPAHYAGAEQSGIPRPPSAHSISPTTPSVADIEALEQAMRPTMQRSPAQGIDANFHVPRPLPLRSASEDNLSRNTWRLSNPVLTPPVPSGGTRPLLLGRSISMAPISEGPAAPLPAAPSTTRARPAPLSPLTLNPTTVSANRISLPPLNETRPRPNGKRNSVFARPIPIATRSHSRDTSSPSASSRMSMVTSSSPTSSPATYSPAASPFLLTPSQYYTPPTTSSLGSDKDSPTIYIARSRPSSMIRPASLVVEPPWPTPPFDGPNDSVPTPDSMDDLPTPKTIEKPLPAPTANADHRTSIAVPIIRPPLAGRQSLVGPANTRAKKMLSGVLVFPPPANPPPTRRLPPPPVSVR